jgi:ABC-type transporter Mla subunit MlaD
MNRHTSALIESVRTLIEQDEILTESCDEACDEAAVDMTSEISEALAVLAEKIQSPSNPKGRAAYIKSLTAWSKAASKVAKSYGDKLGDMRQVTDAEAARKAQLDKLLQSVSGQLAQAAELANSLG